MRPGRGEGIESRSSHQTRKPRRSDSVWTRDWPLNLVRYAATANRNTGRVATTTPETAGSDREVSMNPLPIHQHRQSRPLIERQIR